MSQVSHTGSFWLFSVTNTCVRDRSQTMSATDGGRGVWKMLKIADKGGNGGQANADNCRQRGEGDRQRLSITDKGGWRAAYANRPLVSRPYMQLIE